MKRFDVTVKEVWNQTYTVHAENEAEAIAKVQEGDSETQDGSFEYNYCLDTDTWEVNEE